MATCATLQIVGSSLELVGFGAVAWDLYRVRREVFGPSETWGRVKRWVHARLHGPPEAPVTHAPFMGSSLGGNVSVEGPPELETIEQRVAFLEELFRTLAKRVQQVDQSAATNVETLRGEVNALKDQLASEQETRKQQEQRSTRSSVSLQAAGTLLFAIGTALSILGNTTTC